MVRCLGPALAAVALHAALLAIYVASFHGDAAALVCVGSERLGEAPYEAIHLAQETAGYDGQFYYAIARNPWQSHRLGIDNPALRHVRILYPALCWLLSLGNQYLLLIAMPLVNLLAIGLLAWMGAILALRQGLNPWLGFFLPLALAAALPALRDLTDVVSICAVCGLVTAYLLGASPILLGLTAGAAVFAREQNVCILLLVGAICTYHRRTRDLAATGAALGCWALWLTVLRVTYGQWALTAAHGNLGWPGVGLGYRLTHLTDAGSRLSIVTNVACLLLILFQVLLTLRLLFIRTNRLPLSIAIAGIALACCAGVPIYEDKWSYMRVFAWLPLGCWLACIQARLVWPALLLSSASLLPFVIVARHALGGSAL